MKNAILLSAFLFSLILSACSPSPATEVNPTDSSEETQPEQVTLKGTYVCLPHEDGTALEVDECAQGIQTEDGVYYGFDTIFSSASPDLWNFKAGDPIIASGVLLSLDENLSTIDGVQWGNYPIEWVFSATIKLKHESNFIFTYGIGPVKNELNTIQGTFTKDMIVDPAIQISLELSDEEVQSVLDKIKELDLFNAPNEAFDYQTFTSPCETYSLDVDYGASGGGGMEWDCNTPSDARKEFVEFMRSLIDSKEEVKALPEPEGAYL